MKTYIFLITSINTSINTAVIHTNFDIKNKNLRQIKQEQH